MVKPDFVTARERALAPVRKENATEAIARRIGEAIGSGVLAPGERLPSEADLAVMLEVAPMTLRTATAALRDAGLLEIRRGRGGGTFVAVDAHRLSVDGIPSLRRESFAELTVWRRAVSGEVAAQAARLASANDRGRIRNAARDVDAAADERTGFRLADSRFHLTLAEVGANDRLLAAEMAIQAELSESLVHVPSPGLSSHISAAGHDPIVAAIEAGDMVAARQAMEDHVSATYDWIAGYTLGFE
jgi:GntR family transcriptional regulator, transcriptional repressor for pyruvate dehydrogenase complex